MLTIKKPTPKFSSQSVDLLSWRLQNKWIDCACVLYQVEFSSLQKFLPIHRVLSDVDGDHKHWMWPAEKCTMGTMWFVKHFQFKGLVLTLAQELWQVWACSRQHSPRCCIHKGGSSLASGSTCLQDLVDLRLVSDHNFFQAMDYTGTLGAETTC